MSLDLARLGVALTSRSIPGHRLCPRRWSSTCRRGRIVLLLRATKKTKPFEEFLLRFEGGRRLGRGFVRLSHAAMTSLVTGRGGQGNLVNIDTTTGNTRRLRDVR